MNVTLTLPNELFFYIQRCVGRDIDDAEQLLLVGGDDSTAFEDELTHAKRLIKILDFIENTQIHTF